MIYSNIPLYIVTLGLSLFGRGSNSLCLVIANYNMFLTTSKHLAFGSLHWFQIFVLV